MVLETTCAIHSLQGALNTKLSYGSTEKYGFETPILLYK